jgi:1-acyl-sn-glycerol-3-phosphate acyltransferase
MRILQKAALILYNGWCLVWFVGIYLLLFPFIFVSIQYKPWHPIGHRLTQYWSYSFFFIIGKQIQVDRRFKVNPNETYVFVANHFSYFDIAAGMGIFNNYFGFVGKSSVKKIPLIGYMFSKLHIMVDRSDGSSRSSSLSRGIKSLKSGKSVFIMPEGGIISKNIPQMLHPFKDGAFIMAAESQVPIVPITFVNMYKIMPAAMIGRGTPKVIIHEAIPTAGKGKKDIATLKEDVYQIMQNAIDENQ